MIPCSSVGYKERSFLKIFYGLVFGKGETGKNEVVKFMQSMASKDRCKNIKIYLPQAYVSFFVKSIKKLVGVFGFRDNVDFVVAHLEEDQVSIPVITIMPMFFQDCFTVSRCGWGTRSALAGSLVGRSRFSDQRIRARVNGRVTKLSSPNGKERSSDLSSLELLSGLTVLVPLQLPWDETLRFKFGKDWVWFVRRVIQFSKSNRDVSFIIRVHPLHNLSSAEERELSELCLRENVYLSNSSLYDDFDRSDALIVINSGVGFEALCAGLPVLSFGDSIYRQFTFCVDYKSQEDFDLLFAIDQASIFRERFIKGQERFISENLFVAEDFTHGKEFKELKFGC